MYTRTIALKDFEKIDIDINDIQRLIIDLSQPDNIKLQSIIEKLQDVTSIIEINFKPAESAKNKEFKDFCNQLNAIAVRNRLIQDLDIKPKPPVWGNVMHTVIDQGFFIKREGDKSVLEYNPQQGKQGLKSFIKRSFKQMGSVGFKQFCKSILSYSNPLPSDFRVSFESGIGMTTLEVINYLSDLKEQEDQSLPFKNIILECDISLQYNDEFFKALLRFLKNNPQLETIEFKAVHHSVFPVFYNFNRNLANAGIGTVVKLPRTSDSTEDPANILADTAIEAKTRKILKNATIQPQRPYNVLGPPQTVDPEIWWKPLPDSAFEIERQYVYEHQVAVETEIQTEAEHAIITEISHQEEQIAEMQLDFEPFLKDLLDEKQIKQRKLGKEYYNAIVGNTRLKKDWKIDFFTEGACEQIEKCYEAFLDGIVFDPDRPKDINLPKGFGFILARDGKRVLFYDSRLKENPKHAAFRLDLNKPNNQKIKDEGSYALFVRDRKLIREHKEGGEGGGIEQAFNMYMKGGTLDKKSASFSLDLLMSCLDDKEAQKIRGTYQEILEDFNLKNLLALREIFKTGGTAGISQFLKNCHDLKEQGLYQNFKACFINVTENLMMLHSEEAREAIGYLINLTGPQKAWWNVLTASAARFGKGVASSLFFVDHVNAFRYFCDELERLGIDIARVKLPTGVLRVTNISTSLNRILLILQKNPARAEEQLANLADVPLDNDGAFFAVRQGFHFVMSEMELTPHSISSSDLNYRVEFKHLANIAGSTNRSHGDANEIQYYNITKQFFFRYLGTSNTPLAIETIRKIAAEVESIDAVGPTKLNVKALLFPAIARTIEGPLSCHLDNLSYGNQLVTILKDAKEPKNIASGLLAFAECHENINLRDLVGMASFLKANPLIEIEWEKFHQSVGPDAYKAFVQLGLRGASQKENKEQLSFEDILNFSKRISEVKDLPKANVFSAIAALPINFEQAKKLLGQFIILNKHPLSLDRLLLALNQINHEKSTQLPTVAIIEELITASQQKVLSIDSIKRMLTEKIPGIQFEDTSNLPYTDSDFTAELLDIKKLIKESIGKLLGNFSGLISSSLGLQMPQLREFLTDDLIDKELDKFIKEEAPTPQQILIGLDELFNHSSIRPYKSGILLIFNPYEKLKEICLRKLKADFERLTNDPTLSSILSKQVKLALGEIDFSKDTKDSVEERKPFFERYDFYKSISQKILKAANQPRYAAFCTMLGGALEKASLDNKRSILEIVYTLLDAPIEEFARQVLLFEVCLKIGNQGPAFIRNFNLIQSRSKRSADCLLKKYKSLKCDDILVLHQKVCAILVALPYDCDVDSLLVPFLTFEGDELIKFLTALDGLKDRGGPLRNQFFLQLLRKLIGRTQPSIVDLIDCLNKLGDIKLEDSAIPGILKRFEKINHLSFAGFLKKLKQDKSLEDILNEHEINPKGIRDIEAQFADNEHLPRLLKIERPLQESKSSISLETQFKKLVAKGREIAQYKDDMLRTGLQEAIKQYRAASNNDNLIILLAYLRETLYRTPPYYFANEMQMLTILNHFEGNPYTIGGIDTGQGKSIICALVAAVLHSLGHTAVVLSSTDDLTERDFNEFKDFFTALGAESAYIEKSSPIGTFKVGGINFATTSDFGLYVQIAKRRGESLRKRRDPDGNIIKVPLSGMFDEIDDLLLNKSGRDHFILSVPGDQKEEDTCWMYDHINTFVDFLEKRALYLNSDLQTVPLPREEDFREIADFFKGTMTEYKHKLNNITEQTIATKTIIGLEVYTLKKYLATKVVDPQQKRQLDNENFVFLLKKLIQSGKSVKKNIYPTFNKANGFQVKRCHRYSEDKKIEGTSTIEILVDGQPIKGLQYGRGEQQLLAARLEKDPVFRKEGFPFLKEPLRVVTSTMNPDLLVKKFQKDPQSIIIGVTGSTGSLQQTDELQKLYGFNTYLHPPQQLKNLKSLPDVLSEDDATQVQDVKKVILDQKGRDRTAQPWLVHCRDIDRVASVKEELERLMPPGFTLKVLTAQNKDDMEEILGSFNDNTIVISTILGRGTHIEMLKDKGEEAKGADRFKHPKGLGVIDLDLCSETVEKQGLGRTSRQEQPGTYCRVLSMARIKKQHPNYFVGKRRQDYPAVIKQIQGHMDLKSQFQRERDLLFDQLSLVLQQQFDKWQRLFEKKLHEKKEEKKEEKKGYFDRRHRHDWARELSNLDKMRQNAIERFADLWHELPILHDDKLKEMTPQQQLSFLQDRIKKEAVFLWEEQLKYFLNRWKVIHGEDKAPPIDKDKLEKPRILERFVELRQMHCKKEEKPVGLDYHQLMGLSKDPLLQTHIEAKKWGRHSMGQDKDFFEGCKKDNTREIGRYRSWYTAGFDRKREAKRFLEERTKNPNCFYDIFYALNASFESTLKTDVDDTHSWSSWFFGARSTVSRFRQILTLEKQKILTHCSATDLSAIIKEELSHVERVLTIETNRRIYREFSYNTHLKKPMVFLQREINKYLTSSQDKKQTKIKVQDKKQTKIKVQDEKQTQIKVPEKYLMEVYQRLKRIVRSPEYNKKHCSLHTLLKSLSYLIKISNLMRSANPLSPDEVKAKLEWIAPQVQTPKLKTTRTWGEFFRGRSMRVVCPEGYDEKTYQAILGLTTRSEDKYKLYAILGDVNRKLVKAFHAIDMEFTGEISADDHKSNPGKQYDIEVSFRALNRQTGETNDYIFKAKIDLALNNPLIFQEVQSKGADLALDDRLSIIKDRVLGKTT